MEEAGVVSLWVASELTREQLDRAFQAAYTEDGDWIAPSFAAAFGIGYFDEATREAAMLDEPASTVSRALSGFSYDETIAPRFENLGAARLQHPVNGIALLYDYRFSGRPDRAMVAGATWRYMGCVAYD